MTRKPKAKNYPEQRKVPRIAPQSAPEKFSEKKPAWKVGAIDFYGPFGWQNIDFGILLEIQKKLRNFESQTWQEIERTGNNHFIKRSDIVTEARKRLRELCLEDIDELYSLRLSGKERIWGIREREILRILWWDPDHKVYPVSKNHT